jgi:hypothetical protein
MEFYPAGAAVETDSMAFGVKFLGSPVRAVASLKLLQDQSSPGFFRTLRCSSPKLVGVNACLFCKASSIYHLVFFPEENLIDLECFY